MSVIPNNPSAAAFRPGSWNIRAQPEYIQDLYAMWSQRALSWEGEESSTNVITWFVDHRHLRHCYVSRTVTLYENFGEWEGRLLQASMERDARSERAHGN